MQVCFQIGLVSYFVFCRNCAIKNNNEDWTQYITWLNHRKILVTTDRIYRQKRLHCTNSFGFHKPVDSYRSYTRTFVCCIIICMESVTHAVGFPSRRTLALLIYAKSCSGSMFECPAARTCVYVCAKVTLHTAAAGCCCSVIAFQEGQMKWMVELFPSQDNVNQISFEWEELQVGGYAFAYIVLSSKLLKGIQIANSLLEKQHKQEKNWRRFGVKISKIFLKRS